MDVTFHPRRFFDSIQQPNRLRRSITWHIGLIVLFCVLVMAFTYSMMDDWIGDNDLVTPGIKGIPSYLSAILAWACYYALPVLCLVEAPFVAMFLVVDVILWRDRGSYRLFFKGALYAMTVYVWLAFIVYGIDILLAVFSSHIERLSSYVQPLYSLYEFRLWAWTWKNWLLAGAMTWQHALILCHVMGRRFSDLEPLHPGRRVAISLVVMVAWLAAMYLVLFDVYTGLRFATVRYS